MTDVQTTVCIIDVAVVTVRAADRIGVAASIGACGTVGGETGDVAGRISTDQASGCESAHALLIAVIRSALAITDDINCGSDRIDRRLVVARLGALTWQNVI